jgi:hypothetical protein
LSFKIKILALTLCLAACGKDAVHTGDVTLEGLTTTEKKSDLPASQVAYAQQPLNVRSSPSRKGEVLGRLNQNDKVKIVKTGSAKSEFIQIEILETSAAIKPADAYFVSFKYLASSPQGSATEVDTSLFVIQNVATEKLRVYQKRCEANVCKNKMILETEIVVGQARDDTKTSLGSFRITKWVKFYEDGGKLYPSWYDPKYPPMPERGKGFNSWRSEDVLPGGKGTMRGAFGWYTALVGPNSNNQWTHGTIGWGVDKVKYIKLPRKWYVNLVSKPRSHGCTRTDNESIAYLRQILPIGTPVFKIYTNESIYDPSLSEYSQEKKKWEYIMTKNGVRTDGQKADRQEVLAKGTPSDQWLEEGTYEINAYPKIRDLSDRYDAGKENISGTYFIDVGLLDGYSHPKTLHVAGSKESLPEYLTYKLGPPLAKNDQDRKKDESKEKDKDKTKDDDDDDDSEDEKSAGASETKSRDS